MTELEGYGQSTMRWLARRDPRGVAARRSLLKISSAQIQHGGRGLDLLVVALTGDDGGADGEELDGVADPAVALLLQGDADDALGADLLRRALHALHRQLACVVEGLGEVGELDVAPGLRHRLQHAAVGDVVDAAAHDHADGAMPGAQEGPEVLAGEVAGEGTTVGGTVKDAVAVLDGCADGDELGHVLAPLVAPDVQAHADDAVCAE